MHRVNISSPFGESLRSPHEAAFTVAAAATAIVPRAHAELRSPATFHVPRRAGVSLLAALGLAPALPVL